MKVKIFLNGLHQLGDLEDEVNHFFTKEGLKSDDVIDVKTISPDTGEIALVVVYEAE